MAGTNETEASVSDRDDIIAMFSASGYHRARVTSLDNFNRIVGGIAWALARYDEVSVATDLLYEETEDKNIKLRTEQSEKIIEALHEVKCPHELSAHQLLGLDYASLKNVVQWLLRHMLAQDAKLEKYEFFMEWFTMGHSSEEEAIAEYRRRLRRPNRPSTARHMKRFDSSAIFDLTLDAKCTLAEYVVYSRTGKRLIPEKDEEAPSEEASNLQEASSKKHVPTSTVREMMDQAVVELFKDDSPKVVEKCEELCAIIDEFNIPQRLSALEDRLVDEAVAFKQAKEVYAQLENRFALVRETIDKCDAGDMAQMAEVLRTFQCVQTRAHEMRNNVVQDLDVAKKLEQKLRSNIDDQGNVMKYDVHKRDLMERHAQKTEDYAISVRDVLSLQFRLDRILGNSLSNHYRRRNMERMNDSIILNREMKSTVIDYNITIDILTFSSKITGFMNQVEQSLMAEPASQEYRDAFVSYMNDVRTQLGEYHWKAKLTQDNTISEKQTLAALRTTIRFKEREVACTSHELSKLLGLNDFLQITAEEMTSFESTSPVCQEAKEKREKARRN